MGRTGTTGKPAHDSGKSPAVASLRKFTAAKSSETDPEEELEEGLEASFPASDPVSVTGSSISTGRVDAAKIRSKKNSGK